MDLGKKVLILGSTIWALTSPLYISGCSVAEQEEKVKQEEVRNEESGLEKLVNSLNSEKAEELNESTKDMNSKDAVKIYNTVIDMLEEPLKEIGKYKPEQYTEEQREKIALGYNELYYAFSHTLGEKQAEQYIRKALQFKERDMYYNNLGYNLVKQDRLREAIDAYQKCLEISTDEERKGKVKIYIQKCKDRL